jgi:hypothetical protein
VPPDHPARSGKPSNSAEGHGTNSDIIYCDATKLAKLIRTREVSPVEVMQAFLDRLEAVNPKLNAIVTVADDGTLEAARTAEAAVMAGAELRHPAAGLPSQTSCLAAACSSASTSASVRMGLVT